MTESEETAEILSEAVTVTADVTQTDWKVTFNKRPTKVNYYACTAIS